MTFWPRASQRHPGRRWLVSLTSPQEPAISGSNWWIRDVATLFSASFSLSVGSGWMRSQAAEREPESQSVVSIYHIHTAHFIYLHFAASYLPLCTSENTQWLPWYLVAEARFGHGLWLFLFLTDTVLYTAPGLQFRGDNSINAAKACISKPGVFFFVWEICIIKLCLTAERPRTFSAFKLLRYNEKWNMRSLPGKAVTSTTRCPYCLPMEMFHIRSVSLNTRAESVKVLDVTLEVWFPESTVHTERRRLLVHNIKDVIFTAGQYFTPVK